jgi:hypothetical protein
MHSIRLRQPWRQQWSEPTLDQDSPCLALYGRAFNAPTGLEPQQSIAVVVQPTAAMVIRAITLNNRQLRLIQRDGQTRADLTDTLLAFNQLEILVEVAERCAQPPPLTDMAEVRIEIA